MDCVIIDDEPLARKVVKNYCGNLPFINIQKECKSALEAIDFLNDHEVDLIFLDINMPKLKGLDFLRTLHNPPLIIITTAYQEFAIESFELNVIDYLLKPFSFERFLKAVNKAQTQKKLMHSAKLGDSQDSVSNQQVNEKSAAPSSHVDESIFIKSDKKTHQVLLSEILYLESYGSYVKVHLQNETIVTLERLTNFEHSLPTHQFIRVHRSYIVAIKKIQTIEGNQVKINGNMLPVGSVYKHNLMDVIKQ
jgi:DNA-binding LytR/AlgR family response regulator